MFFRFHGVLHVFFIALGSFPNLGGAYSLPTEPLRFENLKPDSSREVLDAQGTPLTYLPTGTFRLYRSLSQLPQSLSDFVVWLEDDKFWSHNGFDLKEIKNSLHQNLESGKLKRGGSTLSQQLVKNLFLDKDKSFARKLYEIPWTYRLEKDLSKKQILELYLNVVEWGPGVWGAEAAARYFFDKTATNLTPIESLYLALILPNPKRFDLLVHPQRRSFLLQKKIAFLRRALEEKKVSREEFTQLSQEDFPIATRDSQQYLSPRTHNPEFTPLSNLLQPLYSKATQNFPLRLTLLQADQLDFQKWPLVTLPRAPARYALLKREGVLVAIRYLKSGTTLMPPKDTQDTLSYVSKINLQQLLSTPR